MTFQVALKRESISPSVLSVNEMRDALLDEGGVAVTVRINESVTSVDLSEWQAVKIQGHSDQMTSFLIRKC